MTVRGGPPLDAPGAARLFCFRARARAAGTGTEPLMQQGKIVIADDDPLIRMDLKIMLEELGHIVVGEAENGESACYLAKSLKPDLVILDIMMPKVDGLQAAAAISGDRLAPVLML